MSALSVQLRLPYPPSVNHYYRRVGPRTLISREGRAFRKTVCALLARRGVRPLQGPLVVTLAVYPPDRRRRDIDNVLKALLDALEHGGAYGDDSQITALRAYKMDPVRPDGAVVVTLAAAREASS